MLSPNLEDFGLGIREQNFRPLLGHGIFTQDGTAWKISRDLLRPIFNRQRTEYFSHIQSTVSILLSRIAMKTSKSQELVELQTLFFLLTLDVITAAVLGTSTNSLQGKENGPEMRFTKAFNEAQHYLAIRGRLGDFYWALGGKKFRIACTIVHEFVDKIVARSVKGDIGERAAKRREKGDYVFIEALSKETNDVKVIRNQLVNILLAGRDTTACLLSWTM